MVIHDDGSSIENYLFHRTSDGADQVMWTQLRSGFMDKGGVYVASCKKLTP